MELPAFGIPAFPDINLAFFVNIPVLIIILVLFFVGYAITSGVLLYHWSMYGMRSPGILVAETLFLFVSLVLFVFAGLSISYF